MKMKVRFTVRRTRRGRVETRKGRISVHNGVLFHGLVMDAVYSRYPVSQGWVLIGYGSSLNAAAKTQRRANRPTKR